MLVAAAWCIIECSLAIRREVWFGGNWSSGRVGDVRGVSGRVKISLDQQAGLFLSGLAPQPQQKTRYGHAEAMCGRLVKGPCPPRAPPLPKPKVSSWFECLFEFGLISTGKASYELVKVGV